MVADQSGQRDQDGVADGVPEPVVDVLEPVHVEDRGGQRRAVPCGQRRQLGEPFGHAPAVRDPGQRVGPAELYDLGLGPLQLGDHLGLLAGLFAAAQRLPLRLLHLEAHP